MNDLKHKIEQIQKEFHYALSQAADESKLETIRIEFLGRNGKIAALMTELKALPVEEKRTFGPLLNELKNGIEEALAQAKEGASQQRAGLDTKKHKLFDVTAYKPKELQGSLHIYTQITQQLEDIFISMGYEIADGPELETDYNNFGALNIPEDHPARDMFDTFWLSDPGFLLRTHTSPVQIREMQKKGAPIALVAPGRAYRHEAVDAKHNFMFRQIA